MTVAHVRHPFDESFARDTIPALKAAGWTDAIRYAVGAGKAISRAEWDAFHAAGMSVTLVDEGGQQTALGGYALGLVRARAVMAVMDTLGLPRSPAAACYYVGDDPQPIAARYYPTVAAYFQGVAAVHRAYGGRRVGDYGSGAQINYVRAHVPEVTLEWPVRTWQLSQHPNLIQEPNPTMDTLGHTIDQDTAVTADWGQWPRPTTATEDLIIMARNALPAAALPAKVAYAGWKPDGTQFDVIWDGADGHSYHDWFVPGSGAGAGWTGPEDLTTPG